MKERKVASLILDNIGGYENINSVEHCATRLRLTLKNDELINTQEIQEIDGVKGYFLTSGQHQIILGTGFVNKVYGVITENNDISTNQDSNSKTLNVFQKISRTLGDVFIPIIPVLVATGLFMGLRGFLQNLNVTMDPTFLTFTQILTDTAFGFLPALIGYSVAKKFGGNPIIGIVIGLMLVAPQLPNANAVGRGDAEPIILAIMGLKIPIIGYQGSVLPTLSIVFIATKIEKNLKKIVPDFLDLIVTPFITLLLSIVIGLVFVGPVMYIVEHAIVDAFAYILNFPLGIGGLIIGGLQQAIVVTGLHHAFRALEIDLLATTGLNAFNAITTGAIAAQAGAAFAVAFKSKDKKKKSLYLSAALPAFFGITEPVIFGVNLRLGKPFVFALIGGAVAGLFTSIVKLAGTGLAITMIPGALLYLDQLPLYFIAMLIGFVVAFGLTFALHKTEE